MRKAFATVALTIGALGATAGAASADPVIDDNEHANTGDGVSIPVSDLVTNPEIANNLLEEGILNGSDVLGDGILTEGILNGSALLNGVSVDVL